MKKIIVMKGASVGKSMSDELYSKCDLQIVRQSALKWWHSLAFEDQFYKTIDWLSSNNRDTTERHPHNLTGREIQEIHEHHSA